MEAVGFRKCPEVRDAIVAVTDKSVKTREKWKREDMKKGLSAHTRFYHQLDYLEISGSRVLSFDLHIRFGPFS